MKQVDNDGKFAYSNVESADFSIDASVFSVSLNPATSAIKITIPANNAVSNISIYDIKGRQLVYEVVAADNNSKTLDVSKLAAGVYNVVLTQNGKIQTIKFLKK